MRADQRVRRQELDVDTGILGYRVFVGKTEPR